MNCSATHTLLRKQTMQYINCTPHTIVLNDGREFPASGVIPRVSVHFTDIIDDVCSQCFGQVVGLPEPQADTMYIVSAMVLAALASSRPDVVAPATGHPGVVRENGHIVSVPCFTR
jgi:hypothetical protein